MARDLCCVYISSEQTGFWTGGGQWEPGADVEFAGCPAHSTAGLVTLQYSQLLSFQVVVNLGKLKWLRFNVNLR